MTANGEEIAPDDPRFVYNEFALLSENAAEYDLLVPQHGLPRRVDVPVDGRTVSVIEWGDVRPGQAPTYLFVHGGAQNAHTWDTVLVALGAPSALCVDLPGHGRSEWRDDGDYSPRTNAAALAGVLDAYGAPALVVAMSLGGLSALALAALRPDLVRRLVLVDITPGVDAEKSAQIHAFIAGPQTFDTFADLFDRTQQFNPTRTPTSLRRGILHNAHRRDDGTWEWNYDRRRMTEITADAAALEMAALWDAVTTAGDRLLLVQGVESPVVDDADIDELLRRRPDADVLRMEGAGHSVQGDRPVELAGVVADFVVA